MIKKLTCAMSIPKTGAHNFISGPFTRVNQFVTLAKPIPSAGTLFKNQMGLTTEHTKDCNFFTSTFASLMKTSLAYN
uniref:Uncharacterized protein n=1 Tax=Pararge aegeria TaxID=116150 RepID=S4NXF2_9NEOP